MEAVYLCKWNSTHPIKSPTIPILYPSPLWPIYFPNSENDNHVEVQQRVPPNLYKHISACKAFGKGTRYTSWIVFVIVLKSLCQHAGRQRVNAVCRQQCCSQIFEITVAETDFILDLRMIHRAPEHSCRSNYVLLCHTSFCLGLSLTKYFHHIVIKWDIFSFQCIVSITLYHKKKKSSIFHCGPVIRIRTLTVFQNSPVSFIHWAQGCSLWLHRYGAVCWPYLMVFFRWYFKEK